MPMQTIRMEVAITALMMLKGNLAVFDKRTITCVVITQVNAPYKIPVMILPVIE
jgi:hypothetical protein